MTVADVAVPVVQLGPRERLDRLADAGSLQVEEDVAEVLTAQATVGGTTCQLFALDPVARGGGALSAAGTCAITGAYRRATARGFPVVGVWHSGGARIDEGVSALNSVGEMFSAMTLASGRVPQVSLVTGPAAGGAAYGPGLTDVVVMSPEARVFVTGPKIIAEVTGEQITMDELGGPEVHGRESGVAHIVADSDRDAFNRVAALVPLLAGQRGALVESGRQELDPSRHMPASRRRAYDVGPIVRDLLDEGSSQELHRRWAPNLVTALGRWQGRPVGVLANNPIRLAGCLDARSAEKGARFVRMCDALGLPLVVLVDVPGFLPSRREESGGVVRRGAKLLHAFAASNVPRVTVVMRKAYGGAYIAMNSRSLGATQVFAWPDAEVGVMGGQAAVRLLHRRTLAEALPDQLPQIEAELVRRYEAEAVHVDHALRLGVVDEIVAPSETRCAVSEAIESASRSGHGVLRGWHSNIPL